MIIPSEQEGHGRQEEDGAAAAATAISL